MLNHTSSLETSVVFNEIIADQTTPDAVLLAANSAVVRMYPNGATEVLVGDLNTGGCV